MKSFFASAAMAAIAVCQRPRGGDTIPDIIPTTMDGCFEYIRVMTWDFYKGCITKKEDCEEN